MGHRPRCASEGPPLAGGASPVCQKQQGHTGRCLSTGPAGSNNYTEWMRQDLVALDAMVAAPQCTCLIGRPNPDCPLGAEVGNHKPPSAIDAAAAKQQTPEIIAQRQAEDRRMIAVLAAEKALLEEARAGTWRSELLRLAHKLRRVNLTTWQDYAAGGAGE